MLLTIPRRRRILPFIGGIVFLYVIIALGPPVFTPKSKATASKWAQSLNNDLTSMYHSSQGALHGNSYREQNPRIRQATMLFEGNEDNLRMMYERSVETHVKHGERWGVPTHILKQSLVGEGSYFNKPAYLLSLIMVELAKPKRQRAEWIVWFDGDSIIMNPSIPWDVFLPPVDFNDKHILATQDNNGLNAGMLILRVHEWTVNTLSEILAVRSLRSDVPLPFFDQSAMAWICGRPGYQEHFLYQPREWWNRYHHDPNGEEVGNMLIHFAGVSTVMKGSTTKIEYMTKFLEKVEKTPQDWSKDIAATTYQKEIDDYWNLLRRSRRLLENAKKWSEESGNQVKKVGEVRDAEKALIETVLKHTDKIDKIQQANARLEATLLT
ncbi:MAG: hypothetical protein Q9217_003212 [Psora testacea]